MDFEVLGLFFLNVVLLISYLWHLLSLVKYLRGKMVENDESSNGWLGLSSMFRKQAIWVSHWRAPMPRPHKPKMKLAMKVPRCYLQVGAYPPEIHNWNGGFNRNITELNRAFSSTPCDWWHRWVVVSWTRSPTNYIDDTDNPRFQIPKTNPFAESFRFGISTLSNTTGHKDECATPGISMFTKPFSKYESTINQSKPR